MWGEGVEQGSDFAPCGFGGSFRCLSQQVLELGEHLFDRVQVGRVWRQVEQLGLRSADCLADGGALVAGQVVHDDDVTRCQCGHEELLDPFGEACAVDRLIEHARCIDPVAAQRGDERHSPPMAIGHFGVQTLAPWCPSAQGSHVGLGPGLIDEDEPRRIKPPLILLPLGAPPCDLGAELLGGKNAFF